MKKGKWKLTNCKVLLAMETAMLVAIMAPMVMQVYRGDYSVLLPLFVVATAGSASTIETRAMIANGY